MDAEWLNWPGGEHPFALRLNELRRLQNSCDAGPEEVFNRLRMGTWKVNDIIEPVRLGLIGGGMDEGEAGPMVTTLVEQYPLLMFKLVALETLRGALLGPPDDMPEKPEGETAPPESGGSQKSTPPEP